MVTPSARSEHRKTARAAASGGCSTRCYGLELAITAIASSTVRPLPSRATTWATLRRISPSRPRSGERELVQLILAGHPTANIAERLGITVGTVKNHRRRIYEKLDITTERELFLQLFQHR